MLQYCFSSTERTRNTICTASCNREKGIDKSDFCDHRLCRSQALCIAVDRSFNRPFERKTDFYIVALFISQSCDCVFECVAALFCNFFYSVRAKQIERNEDFVSERSLRNSTNIFARFEKVANLCCRCEFPLFFLVERVNIDTLLKEPACFFSKQRKRVLQAVIDLSQKAWSKLSRKKVAGKLNDIPRLDSFCHLVDLKLCYISADTDNFAFQATVFYFNIGNFVHRNCSVKFDRNHVSINSDYLSFCIRHLILH